MDEDQGGTIEVDELEEAFKSISEEFKVLHQRDQDGTLSDQDLETIKHFFPNKEDPLEYFRQLNLPEGDEIHELLQRVDVDNDSKIQYSEFLTHTLTDEHLSEKNIRLFFEIMGPKDGYLDDESIQAYFARCGKFNLVQDMMKKSGLNNKLSFDDFYNFMRQVI